MFSALSSVVCVQGEPIYATHAQLLQRELWALRRRVSRASPPHRPREHGLTHPADTSIPNLLTPWLCFRGPNPYLLRTKLSLLCSSSLFALRQLHVRGQYPKGGAVWLAVEERKRELKRQLRA